MFNFLKKTAAITTSIKVLFFPSNLNKTKKHL